MARQPCEKVGPLAFRSLFRQRRPEWRCDVASISAGNNLDGRQSDEMFIYRSELVSERLTSDDTVVFVDDLTATGKQVCEVWEEHFAELVAGVGRAFLIVVVAGRGARKEIKKNTELRLVAGHELRAKDSLFSEDCEYFTAAEKERLLAYSRTANAALPAGFGNCGYVLVFQHRCPNNSVALLHDSNARWSGLFPAMIRAARGGVNFNKLLSASMIRRIFNSIFRGSSPAAPNLARQFRSHQ